MTASYRGVDGQAVIEDIGEFIGLVPEYDGATLRYLPEDQANYEFLVLRSGYKPASELVEDLKALLNSTARVRAVDDRVVVSGTRRDLEQVQRFEKHLQTGPDGWMLNIRIVAVTEAFRRTLGLDWNVRGKLGFNVADGSGAFASDMLVEVIAEATETNLHAYLVNHATMYLLEGSTGRINQGRNVPVPRFSTSPAGTTTTVGFDYIQAGFEFEAKAERVPVGVRLQLEPSISTVVGFIAEAPITEESTVVVDVIVEDGQWVIITGLSVDQASSDRDSIPGLEKLIGNETMIDDRSTLLVMVQAKRIFGASYELESAQ